VSEINSDLAPKAKRIDNGQLAQAVLIIGAIAGLAWLTIKLTPLLLLIFAAVTIAAVFDALASFIVRKTGVGRAYALAATVFLVLTIFIGAFGLFGAQMVREFDAVRETLPAALRSMEAYLDQYGLGDRARELIASGTSDASQLVSRAGGYAIAAGSGLADFVLVLVGAIFLASDPGVYRRGLLLLLPAAAEAPVSAALDDARHGLSGWMLGQSVSSLVVGILTWGGLTLLGVPASGGLAIIAGLLDIIPMVGPVIAGVPAILLAFTVSPMTALWTVVLFLIIQQLQGNFLQPMIQKQAVDVPPALLLFAVFAFGLLFGFLGVLLAAPLTVVVFVAVRRLYVQTILGKAEILAQLV
jgi:predicted PurR-regulated permease PerM